MSLAELHWQKFNRRTRLFSSSDFVDRLSPRTIPNDPRTGRCCGWKLKYHRHKVGGVLSIPMNIWRYQTRMSVEIAAPVERVYALASNPQVVPLYAPEIDKIEVISRLSNQKVLVKSYLKIAGITRPYFYVYHYRPPAHYSGVQQQGALMRGYFTLTFKTSARGTSVSHTEGILSPLPFVAWFIGFIYFHLISRDGMRDELDRLRTLVEAGVA